MWWFRKVLEVVLGGISEFLGIVFNYPRAALPLIMIIAGLIWYITPSAPDPETMPVVVAPKPSPSPPPAVVAEKPVERLKPRPPEPPPVAASRVPPDVEARIPPEIREFMHKRLDQIKNGQPLRQPATPSQDQKVTVEFDMAIRWEERREYFRENPRSRQSDFVLICAPVLLNGLDTVPSEVRNPQYYRQVLADIVKDFTNPQGWGYRAMMSRKWAVIYFDPWQRIYPNPLIESVSRPPVRWDACDGRFDNVSFNRNYLKLTMTR